MRHLGPTFPYLAVALHADPQFEPPSGSGQVAAVANHGDAPAKTRTCHALSVDIRPHADSVLCVPIWFGLLSADLRQADHISRYRLWRNCRFQNASRST